MLGGTPDCVTSGPATLSCIFLRHITFNAHIQLNAGSSGIGPAGTTEDMMTKVTPAAIVIGALVAVAGLPTLVAQEAQPAGGGANQLWWVNKTKGGVYTPPMRPLWKLSDLKQMHAGQSNWQEQIIRDPEQDTLLSEREQALKKALSSLKRVYREAVILRDIEGFAYEEIATTLNISVGTVKSRLARGRQELRRKLEGSL